jgi:hypothetical protein
MRNFIMLAWINLAQDKYKLWAVNTGVSKNAGVA